MILLRQGKTGDFSSFPEKGENGYRHFIALIRKNMQFARYLRVDHILGGSVFTGFPKERGSGRSVRRNFLPDLLGILALESMRNEVTVIGEDLGTVDPLLKRVCTSFRCFPGVLF